MSLRRHKSSKLALSEQEESTKAAASQNRRWRSALVAISFIGALSSLKRKALDRNKPIMPSPSHIAIDSGDEGAPVVNIDHVKILTSLVRKKCFESLRNVGGVKGAAAILKTDEKNGIVGNETEILRRRNVFGANNYTKPHASFKLFHDVFKDNIILILLVCAILSLAFGIKQHGWKQGWYDGGSTMFHVFLTVAVSAVTNFKQNKRFDKLSSESGDVTVVVRDGRGQTVSITEVVVGDMVCLKVGDQIPADGLFLNGHFLKVDESCITGESDHVKINDRKNPFLLSGTKVIDGDGYMLVTSVGINTAREEMMSSINHDLDEQTPLKVRVNKLASYIWKIALAVAISALLVLLIQYFTGNTKEKRGNRRFSRSKAKYDDIMDAVFGIFAAVFKIVVVAFPEGLPLAVTLALAYYSKCLMADNALVRKLSACETIGSVTTICVDKTGTLTSNEMKVTEYHIGAIKNAKASDLAPNFYELLREGVDLNTTGTVYKSISASSPHISGSPTEKAILSWAVRDFGIDLDYAKQNCRVLSVEAFNSEKKRSGVLIRRISDKAIHTHWQGAAEVILANCSHYYDTSGAMRVMDDKERMEIETIIKGMAGQSLRCIAFAHTKVEEENGQTHKKLEESGLTLLGLVGLKDPYQPGVRTAVESLKEAGVHIKMMTGDGLYTAIATAIECGILQPSDMDVDDEAVLEGARFRNFSHEKRMEMVDKILVMARCSASDKHLMVQSLKHKGHDLDGTNYTSNDSIRPFSNDSKSLFIYLRDLILLAGIRANQILTICNTRL